MDQPTVRTLEAVHRDLVSRMLAGERDLAPVAASVPELVAMVERYVPEVDAVILSRGELRELVTAVVVDVLETQARCRQRRRKKSPRAL